jgi:hypothetical protein
MTVEERRDANVKRAKLIYEDLVNSGEKINEFVLNTYLNGTQFRHVLSLA